METILKFLIDESDEIMIVCDSEGIITHVNNSGLSLLDYSADMLVGQSVEILFLDKDFSCNRILEEAKKKSLRYEETIYKKNKTCFQIELKVSYFESDNLYTFIGKDLTAVIKARKDMEFVAERAKEAGKIRDEFVANVTHELRTPVNGIKGHTQYLMMTELSNDQSKELKIINECCLNMEKLINNILDFSKLESGKFTINEKDFVFADFMKYVTEINGKLIEDKGLRFIVNVDETIPERLYGDDFRLTQIMNNLLSNALKFTQKGYVAIEVTRSMQVGRDVELFFMVMDTGIGIPDDKKDQMFESFTQVDASISRTYGGTGLGLAITKQLVNLMNGSIKVESEYGKGSSFTFTVRMKIPEDVEINDEGNVSVPIRFDHSKMARTLLEETDKMNQFGTEENVEEFKKISDRLSLCIELENYEKSEKMADVIKELVLDGPPELKSTAFRMQMMIRKEDGEKARMYLDQLNEAFYNAIK